MKKPLPQTPATPVVSPAVSPAVFGNDVAPVIAFDGCHACGAMNGLLQVELGVNTLVPMLGRENDVRVKPLVVAHLRGTQLAFQQLRAAIDRALEAAAKAATK